MIKCCVYTLPPSLLPHRYPCPRTPSLQGGITQEELSTCLLLTNWYCVWEDSLVT